jgi:crotonobetainyl-CoA:carnitine CoA-transferase CaiB-like acyl-CoA transferase
MTTPHHTPLHGLRVLDASRVLAGPFCGQILGDLGAEVIKIERPGVGDETRAWGPPFVGDLAAYYLSCNRNKKSVTLDLSKPEGQAIAHQLAAMSDIYLDNFLPSSAKKLGLDAARLHQINPKLIICSISGFGHDGPMAERPGYDFAIQALSGFMSITGPKEGPPSKVGVAMTDVVAGLYAAIGVLACVAARQQSGHGYALDISLLDCAVAAQVNLAQAYLTSGEVPPRQGNAHLQIVPYQLFATQDSHLVLAVGNDAQWQRFCKAAQLTDLEKDGRFLANPDRVKSRDMLIPLLDPILLSRTTKAWEELLTAADVPHAPVLDYAQLFAHPQAVARGLRVTVHDLKGQAVDLVSSPFRIHGAAAAAMTMPPRLGEQTESVLREVLGMEAAKIDALKAKGIV